MIWAATISSAIVAALIGAPILLMLLAHRLVCGRRAPRPAPTDKRVIKLADYRKAFRCR